MSRIAGRFTENEPRFRAGKLVLSPPSGLPRENCWTIAEWAGGRTPDGMRHLLGRPSGTPTGSATMCDYVVDHLRAWPHSTSARSAAMPPGPAGPPSPCSRTPTSPSYAQPSTPAPDALIPLTRNEIQHTRCPTRPRRRPPGSVGPTGGAATSPIPGRPLPSTSHSGLKRTIYGWSTKCRSGRQRGFPTPLARPPVDYRAARPLLTCSRPVPSLRQRRRPHPRPRPHRPRLRSDSFRRRLRLTPGQHRVRPHRRRVRHWRTGQLLNA